MNARLPTLQPIRTSLIASSVNLIARSKVRFVGVFPRFDERTTPNILITLVMKISNNGYNSYVENGRSVKLTCSNTNIGEVITRGTVSSTSRSVRETLAHSFNKTARPILSPPSKI